MREILNRVGDKWSVQVAVLLEQGTMRFSELKRSIAGISHRVLTATLRGLEFDGFVKRTVHPTNPPRVDYDITPLGRTLLEPVLILAKWAQDHRAEVERARAASGRSRERRPRVRTA
jgi:DNA-binding HxlR family transcriptional regulator